MVPTDRDPIPAEPAQPVEPVVEKKALPYESWVRDSTLFVSVSDGTLNCTFRQIWNHMRQGGLVYIIRSNTDTVIRYQFVERINAEELRVICSDTIYKADTMDSYPSEVV